MHHVDFTREDVDVAVWHGDGNWGGLDAVRLCSEQLFPICSPKLLSSRIVKPSDFPLLHLDDWKAWSNWLDAAGVVDAATPRGPALNHASMLVDAAIDGQGVALAHTVLAAWDLINGRLARPFDMGFEIIQDLSDRLPECKFKHSEDRNLSEMAAGRGGPRYALSQKDVCRNTITMNASSMDLFCLAVSRGNLIST